MSRKHKDKRSCCCCPCECCDPCCCSGYMNNYGNGGFGNIGGTGCGLWEAILFWLIACGAGLLNNNSILIILLFLLYGWCGDNGCGNSFGW